MAELAEQGLSVSLKFQEGANKITFAGKHQEG